MPYAYDFTPDSIIHILKDIPLDPSYRNTIDWAFYDGTSIENTVQYTWFIDHKKYTVNNATYVREQRMMRVNIKLDYLYDCNYLMYANKNYTDKWFYAFITKLEYASENSTNIYFELDLMQTWYKDINWMPSFILREHTASDNLGEHLVPEDIDTGDLIYYNEYEAEGFQDLVAVVCTTAESDQNVTGGVYSGIYSGAKMYAFKINNFVAEGLDDFLGALDNAGKGGAVSSIFTFPEAFLRYNSNTHAVNMGESARTLERMVPINLEKIGGYTPKNNKMFNYPYSFIKATNMNGTSAIYQYEFMTVGKTNTIYPFRFIGGFSTNPTIFCIPSSYKGLTGNPDGYLALTGYPQCNWTYGVYQNWLAQNTAAYQYTNLKGGIGATVGGIGGIVEGATSAKGAKGALGKLNVVGNAIGGGLEGAASGVDTILSNMINKYQREIEPNQSKGGSGGMGSNVSAQIQNFFFYQMGVTPEFAIRIDRYFSTYGYKVNDFKVPNLKSRQFWNYIQTIDCNIYASIPQDHLEVIKQIYNNGITLWHDQNVSNYGDYSNPIKKVSN